MDIFREDKGKLRKMNTRKIRSNQQTEKNLENIREYDNKRK